MPDEKTETHELNSFDDFIQRFNALATEAQEHGVQTVVLVMDSDPISRTEDKSLIWRGGAMSAIGLCEWGKDRLLNGKVE